MGKRLKIVVAIIAVVVIGAAAVATWYFTTVNCIDIKYAPDEVVIGIGGNKALIIYEPSKHETTKNMTMIIATTLADLGYTVTVNYPSLQLDYNWEDYDIIAFGSPVYVGEVSPVLKSYVENNPIENKNVLIYATGMAPEETKELEEMTSWVNSDNSIVSIKITKDDGELLTSFVKESMDQWGNDR